jgi:hypothetical protein
VDELHLLVYFLALKLGKRRFLDVSSGCNGETAQ